MRPIALILALAACKIPDVTFIKGDGGPGDGGDIRSCAHGVGFPGVPWPVIGPGVTAIALGDLDGDRVTDLVVAAGTDAASYKLHVLRGQGNGAFVEVQAISLASSATAIALHQIDSNGSIDIVTVHAATDTISVVLNNEDASRFGGPTSYPTGPHPIAVAVGDLNGDSRPDIVTADAGGTRVSVLIGDGSGVFSLPTPVTLPDTPTALALADLDTSKPGLDIVVTVVGVSSPGKAYALYNSSGAFGSAVELGAVGQGPTGIAVGDLDSDGNLDLAISSTDGQISLLYGQGGGGVEAPASPFQVAGATAIAIGDLDDDHHPDVLVTSAAGVHVARGGAQRMFTAPSMAFAGNAPAAVAIAPIGKAGLSQTDPTPQTPAMIAVANTGDDAVTVWVARPDGALIAPVSYDAGDMPDHAIVARLAKDAPPYLVVSSRGASRLSLVNGGGLSMFEVGESDAQPGALAALDLDGDQQLDLVVTDGKHSALDVLYGDGAGSVRSRATIALPSPAQALAVGDLDGNAALDLLAADPDGHHLTRVINPGALGATGDPVALDADSEPSAVAIHAPAGGGPRTVVIADRAKHEVALLNDDGQGGLGPPQPLPSLGAGVPIGVATAPLQPGGANDIVVTVDGAAPSLYVFRHDGAGGYRAPEIYPTGAMPQGPVIADVTGDGVPDVIYADGATVSVLAGIKDGAFQPRVAYGVGRGPGSFAVEDVNGDGAPDLVVPHGAASLSVLTATCVP